VTDYPFLSILGYSSQRDVTYKEIQAEMKDITVDIRIVCKTVMASYIVILFLQHRIAETPWKV